MSEKEKAEISEEKLGKVAGGDISIKYDEEGVAQKIRLTGNDLIDFLTSKNIPVNLGNGMDLEK